MMNRFLAGFKREDAKISKFSRRLAGMNGSDIERICLEAVKIAILDDRKHLLPADIELGLKRYQARLRHIRKGLASNNGTRKAEKPDGK
jgi:ATP-dependent 26S proteasome regulatory subunit